MPGLGAGGANQSVRERLILFSSREQRNGSERPRPTRVWEMSRKSRTEKIILK